MTAFGSNVYRCFSVFFALLFVSGLMRWWGDTGFLTSPDLANLARHRTDDKMLFTLSRTLLDPRTPLIVEVTSFYNKSLFGNRLFGRNDRLCPVHCRLSSNSSHYEQADVALFHMRNLSNLSLFIDSAGACPGRFNILYNFEAPMEDLLPPQIPTNFFNLTLGNSERYDVWIPYDRLERLGTFDTQTPDDIDPAWSNEEVDVIVMNKSILASKIVSNCETNSKREVILKQLKRVADVDLRGSCFKRKCDEPCYDDLIRRSFFYLAFEDAVCQEYLTEKFWTPLKRLTVPVVLKRSVVSGWVPNSMFLAVDDFPNLESFLNALRYFAEHPNEYKKRFFGWTKTYKRVERIGDIYCRLCQLAHDNRRPTVSNIHAWWQSMVSTCTPGFAQNPFSANATFSVTDAFA